MIFTVDIKGRFQLNSELTILRRLVETVSKRNESVLHIVVVKPCPNSRIRVLSTLVVALYTQGDLIHMLDILR